MRPGPLLTLVVAAVALTACGDSSPDSPSPGPNDPVPIRGIERLGWDQQAASSAELSSLRFAIYIDGARSEMPDVSCESVATPSGFPCSGGLPSMRPGVHTLELAAYVMDGSRVVESPRSLPLRVNVSPSLSAPADPASATPSDSSSASAATVPQDSFEQIAVGASFTGITGLAVTSDGWLLVAERAGVLRAMHHDANRESALAIEGTTADGATGSLVDVAADPDFARTRVVYVLQSAPARDGLTWQLVRYRQAGDVFGERAVLLQTGEPGIEATGLVRVGPDGRLYVALEEEGSGRRGRLGVERDSVLLRLNPDGTTPSDQVSASPVVVVARGAARGLDWSPQTGALWMALGDLRNSARLVAFPADVRRARAGLFDHESPMSPRGAVSGIAFYRGDLIPSLRDSLLIAAENGLHRARFDPRNGRIASIDSVIDAPLRAVTSTPDGQLVIATADAVFRARQE